MTMSISDLSFLSEDSQKHLRTVVTDLRRGRVVLFCGAGLSFNASSIDGSPGRLPSWSKLSEALAKDLDERFQNVTSSALEIADLYETVHGRARLVQQLWKLIPDRRFVPSQVHRLIPQMAFREVITTNFDTLIERAFEEEQIQPAIAVRDRDLVHATSPRVIKINGCCERNPAEVVITGEDFRRYDKTHPLFVAFLTDCFVESLVLFVGFSLDDPAFRAIYGRVRDILGRHGRAAFSIQERVDRNRIDFWQEKGIRVLDLRSGKGAQDLSPTARLERVFTALRDSVGTRPLTLRAGNDSSEKILFPNWSFFSEALKQRLDWVDRAGSDCPAERLLAIWFESDCVEFNDPSDELTEEACQRIRRGVDELHCGAQWQRMVLKMLSSTLEDGFRAGHPSSGCIRHSWVRAIVSELMRTVLASTEGGAEESDPIQPPVIFPELPVVFAQICWLNLLYGGTEATVRQGKKDILAALSWLDLRCLMVQDGERQREALMLLLCSGRPEDIRIVLNLMDERASKEDLEAHLRARCGVWIARTDEITPNESSQENLQREWLLALFQNRIAKLPKDFRYRFRQFFSGYVRGDEHREALDWIRRQIDSHPCEEFELHQRELIRRWFDLYEEGRDLAFGSRLRNPHYRNVAAKLRARLEEITPPKRAGYGSGEESLLGYLHDVLSGLKRGRLFGNELPGPLQSAFDIAGRMVSEDSQDSTWDILAILWIFFRDGTLPSKSDHVIEAALKWDRVDVGFVLDVLEHRLGENGLANTGPDGDCGLQVTLTNMARFIEIVTNAVDDERDPEIQKKLLKLVRILLLSRPDLPQVRQSLLSALAQLSRHAPVDYVAEVAIDWLTFVDKNPDIRWIGVSDIDWRRLLLDESTCTKIKPGIVRQVLSRGLDLVAHLDIGPDIHKWAMDLYTIDREARQVHNRSVLADDVVQLIRAYYTVFLQSGIKEGSFNWIFMAAEMRRANLTPDEKVLFADGDGPPPDEDPLFAFVIDGLNEYLGRPDGELNWSLRQRSYLPKLEVFLEREQVRPDMPSMSVSLAELLGRHFAPRTQVRDAQGGVQEAPRPLEDWKEAHRDAVASFISALRRPLGDARFKSVCSGVITRLLAFGATGYGNIAKVADLLKGHDLDQLQQNFLRKLSRNDSLARVAQMRNAHECARLSRENRRPLKTLETQLIRGLDSRFQGVRELACGWLCELLEEASMTRNKWDKTSFPVLHREELRAARVALPDCQIPPRLRKRLDETLQDVLQSPSSISKGQSAHDREATSAV